MSNSRQIRGMLLEEAVLPLLKRSGYRTVDVVGNDHTLCTVGAGVAVKGRGGEHQTDAIRGADEPFCRSSNLLMRDAQFTSSSPLCKKLSRGNSYDQR